MRKTVECAVALLMLLAAVSAATERNWLDLPGDWGFWLIAPRAYLPEKEYPPEIADEMKRLKERNNALFDLNETPPFPCYGYETVAPWDSVQELPLFVGNSSTPCYPCAPRTVLRWNARSDVDDSAYGRGSFGVDGKRFFSTFLHPLKERVGRPSLAEWEWNGIGPDYFGRERFLATLVFAFVSDPGYSRTVDHDELTGSDLAVDGIYADAVAVVFDLIGGVLTEDDEHTCILELFNTLACCLDLILIDNLHFKSPPFNHFSCIILVCFCSGFKLFSL